MKAPQSDLNIESDALRANLLETATEHVEIRPDLKSLLEVVRKYRGIHTSLENLLSEVCHPYRNWNLLLPLLRGFVLKNFNHYRRHEQGPHAFEQFSGLFFEALDDNLRNSVLLSQIFEAQCAWLDKLISQLEKDDLPRFEPAINRMLRRIEELDGVDESLLIHLVHGPHSMKRVIKRLIDLSTRVDVTIDLEPAASLMHLILQKNYTYWLNEDDPLPWFLERCNLTDNDFKEHRIFEAISHEEIRGHQQKLEMIRVDDDAAAALAMILEFPSHIDIVRLYKEIPRYLSDNVSEMISGVGVDYLIENQKLQFMFKIMDTIGLHLIHEEILREINRSLVVLIQQQSFEEIEEFLFITFQLLKANVRKYPHTSLQCIQVLGGEVFKRGNSRMVEAFLWGVVRFGFQPANVTGVDEDWQPIINPAHLSNIRVWLNLIMQEPKWCSTLFSALIIHLKLSGTCVKDTDLFQRDITELLNHPVEPVYNLVKQFAKLMPVFFNEIGAEGELRDVSTELDELHKRKDVLIHFLRKQSHVESSNLIVDFIRAIFIYWKSKDKQYLVPYLPPEVLTQIPAAGKFIDDQAVIAGKAIKEFELARVDDILDIPLQELESFLSRLSCAETERRRFYLLVRMFKLTHKKYNLGFQELRSELQQASRDGYPQMDDLLAKLQDNDIEGIIEATLDALDDLKTYIQAEENFEVREDIYYKRHIAVDIPSVYGKYRERKFDSLSLTFRLENLVNIYLELLPETINLSLITQATFFDISRCLKLYMRALKIDGITSRRLDTYLSLLTSSLKIRRFSYTQYLDIFRGLSEGVKDIIYAYYTNIHQKNLSLIVPQIGEENLLSRYKSLWNEQEMGNTLLSLSEAFFRDLIASTFGLQHLDNFILRVIQTLESQKTILDEKTLDLLMTYNPEKTVSLLDQINPYTHDLIHLGNKGLNLITLVEDNKPVPPAFVLTTEVFRCRNVIFDFPKAREGFMARVRASLNNIESQTGRIFGSSESPLLLSVRSGSAISMPGMMATVHNVGQNEELVEEIVKKGGNGYFAWDNYRRFIQSWAMISGVEREDFQELMNEAKARHNVSLKRQFTPDQMKELALNYQKLVRKRGLGIPDDPWLQLVGAIEMVLDSWETQKATDYRKIMDVSEYWGTAVIVQAMVFGNRNDEAGSGVLFTAHPYRKVRRVALWGDYAYGDQGEDIVSGLVTSHPISFEQAELDGRPREETLEAKFPEIYERLLAISRELVYEKRWNPQEIEFTFEGPDPEDLFLLQTRDMITIKEKEQLNVFDETEQLEQAILGKGIGVSGSALSGKAVFTEEDIARLREEEPDTPQILIRQDTVPEDITVISMTDGLLTSRGGQTSHASVVAVRLEKTCVVGCRALSVYERHCEINGQIIESGDHVSIDGRSGLVVKGFHPIREEMHILPI
ncbi:MAG: phosphoenolpyruvate synthase [Desulfobulbaceae bacterium]|nr:MAG: phosphoenolpyruvate synthase [Desulfobulbaceae bacterium]